MRAGVYSVEVTYPQFTDATPLARLASRTIESWARADVAEFLKATREALAAPQRMPGPYEYTGKSQVTFARPTRLISALLDFYKFTKLKKQEGAIWVREGEMKSLSVAQLNRFSITPRGLVFLFTEYEAGPYASGRFEVLLSTQELGPGFRRALLAAP